MQLILLGSLILLLFQTLEEHKIGEPNMNRADIPLNPTYFYFKHEIANGHGRTIIYAEKQTNPEYVG